MLCREVRAVAHYDVRTIDRLTVDRRIDPRLVPRADRNDAVIDLGSMVATDPDKLIERGDPRR